MARKNALQRRDEFKIPRLDLPAPDIAAITDAQFFSDWDYPPENLIPQSLDDCIDTDLIDPSSIQAGIYREYVPERVEVYEDGEVKEIEVVRGGFAHLFVYGRSKTHPRRMDDKYNAVREFPINWVADGKIDDDTVLLFKGNIVQRKPYYTIISNFKQDSDLVDTEAAREFFDNMIKYTQAYKIPIVTAFCSDESDGEALRERGFTEAFLLHPKTQELLDIYGPETMTDWIVLRIFAKSLDERVPIKIAATQVEYMRSVDENADYSSLAKPVFGERQNRLDWFEPNYTYFEEST